TRVDGDTAEHAGVGAVALLVLQHGFVGGQVGGNGGGGDAARLNGINYLQDRVGEGHVALGAVGAVAAAIDPQVQREPGANVDRQRPRRFEVGEGVEGYCGISWGGGDCDGWGTRWTIRGRNRPGQRNR